MCKNGVQNAQNEKFLQNLSTIGGKPVDNSITFPHLRWITLFFVENPIFFNKLWFFTAICMKINN